MRARSISCLCPTYGRPHILGEAVESFVRQNYEGEMELLIVNDGSPLEMATDIKLPPNRQIRLINVNSRYPSLGWKRNAMADMADGEILMPWDDDDIHLPHRASALMAALNNGHFVRPADLWMLDEDGRICYRWYAAPSTGAFSKESYLMSGGYPSWDKAEDLELERRMEALGVLDHPTLGPKQNGYFYRLHHPDTWHMAYSHDGWQPTEVNSPSRYPIIKPFWLRDYSNDLLQAIASNYNEF